MSGTISIRIATLSDIENLAEMINQAFRAVELGRTWTTEVHLLAGQRTSPLHLKELLKKADVEFLVFDKDETLLGCCLLEVKQTSVYLGMLTVKGQIQGGWHGTRNSTVGRSACP